MMSSGAGALAVSLLMTPLDVVKTRMQGLEAKAKYKNTFDCARWVKFQP